MFRKRKNITSERENLGNYIEGFDVYNSHLLLQLADPSLEKEMYQITAFEYRPDLIAKDFYGSDTYMAYVLLQVGMEIDGYKKGRWIEIVSKIDLDELIKEQ